MHKPVLLKESIDALDLVPGKIFIDGTFGGGGHSREVLRHFPSTTLGTSPHIRVIGMDRDSGVARSNPDFDVRTMSFADIDKLGVKPNAILLDLGISSDQLNSANLQP